LVARLPAGLPVCRCQRWRGGRGTYRPAGEPLPTHRYGVEPLDEGTARAFVTTHHYSRSYPAASVRAGLYRTHRSGVPELVGVAVLGSPAGPKVLEKWLPGTKGLELQRLVLLDDVEANGESWFVRRAFKVVRAERPDVEAVLSYSDPVQRVRFDGRAVMPGHVGQIYKALNGRIEGRGKRRTLYLWRDATVWSDASQEKLRKPEKKGHGYAYRQVLERGMAPRRLRESWPDYVIRLRREGLEGRMLTRTRHPGNYVYTWGLSPRERKLRVRRQGPLLPYPRVCCGRVRTSPAIWLPEADQLALPLRAA